MEETNTIKFPAVGDCVELGQVIGTVGWPSLGRPHLHYEMRNRLPNEGGPGYVSNNPLNDGWFNPQDFTSLWKARFNPAFVSALSFDIVPTLSPKLSDTGAYIVASNDIISAIVAPGQVLWRVQTDGTITSFATLSGDRVVAHTLNGQTVTLQGGRYAAIWTVESGDKPFVELSDRLIFPTADNTLTAFDASGSTIWQRTATEGSRFIYLGSNDNQLGIVEQSTNEAKWLDVNADGQIVGETPLTSTPVVAPQPDGSWLIIDGLQVKRLHGGQNQNVATLDAAPGLATQLVSDSSGNIYIYVDVATRQLVALAADGSPRWNIAYPNAENTSLPLLAVGNGCWLYSLESNGQLNVFSGADGQLLNQLDLYAGGRRTTQPLARLLTVNSAEQVQVSSGFLTMVTLDGSQLGGSC
ncbi:MAG: PQQ-binding-like beta-propeller repeat protein [Anaerolineae bacterium]